MKVRELRKLLAEADDNDEVVMSRDVEGNGYSPFKSFWEGVYVPENAHSGEVHLRELTEADRKMGYTEEDLYDGPDGVPAIILSPIG